MNAMQLRFGFFGIVEESVQLGGSGMPLIPTQPNFFDPKAKVLKATQSLSYCPKISRDCPHLIPSCQTCPQHLEHLSKYSISLDKLI